MKTMFFMTALISFLVSSEIFFRTAYASGVEQGVEEGFEYLMFDEFPLITTASKTTQSISRATSVVTVITEKDILRSGARTLYEVLKRVPGFFPSIQATWTLVCSRGITADGNDHILLLIDGHVQNSVVGQGYQQQDMIPALDKVKQIEIIRGPGSVLWGSSAVWGVINIITKDGDDYTGGQKATAAYGSADAMKSLNYMTSFGTDEAKGILSVSCWESDGYDVPGKDDTTAAFTREEAAAIKGNVRFPWGEDSAWPSIDRHREGYEIYSKISIGDNHILGRVVETNVVYPWDTWMHGPGSDLMMRKSYVEYKKNSVLSEAFSLESIIYGDFLIQNRFPETDSLFRPNNQGKIMTQDQTNEEMAFGLEFIGSFRISDAQNMKAGLKGVRTKIGPNRDARFNVYENYPYDEDPGSGVDLPYIGIESGYDNNLALYSEWMGTFSDYDLFAGVRYDKNDFREDKGIFLPRCGVVYNFSEDMTLKGVYNTGYLRPAAVYSKTVGKIVDRTRGPTQDILLVTDSEKIQSLDIQYFVKKGSSHFALDFFVMDIENFISFDANNTPQGYKNIGDVRSYGAELEARTQASDRIAVYGNYSYALGRLNDDTHQGAITDASDDTLNYPEHIFNLGLDLLISETIIFNLNLNGWRNMNVVLPIDEAETYGEFAELDGEEYLDVSFSANGIFETIFDLSVFCSNILDNTDPVGLVTNNGFYHPRGRNIGGKISVNW